MLDDGAGRGAARIEFGDAFVSSVGIVDIVVGELLALHLTRGRNPEPRRRRAVEGGRLVRVLAVAQRLDQPPANGAIGGRRIGQVLGEPVRDRRIIGGGARKRLGGEPLTQGKGRRSLVRGHLRQHGGVILRLDYHGHVAVVLGRGAHHGRAADVDILDAGGVVGAARHRLLEGVEIDHEKVDRRDAVRFRRFPVRVVVPHREQAAMHFGMQRLHPPIHHLRKAGQVGHVANRQADIGERGLGPARRHEFDAAGRELAGKIGQSRLVRYGEKRAANGAQLIDH